MIQDMDVFLYPDHPLTPSMSINRDLLLDLGVESATRPRCNRLLDLDVIAY